MRRDRRALRLPLLATVVVAMGVSALGGVAWAAFTSAASASQALGTIQLGNPASAMATVTASTSTSCTAITVAWPAATSADAYRVQVRTNGGAWTDLVTETGTVTSHVDTTARTHTKVEYQVFSRDAGSNWEGAAPAVSNPVACGVAPVVDLAASNACTSSTLSWTAPMPLGTFNYDVQRRVNNGTWSTLATDQTATTYTDATVHPLNAVVEYQVRPGIALLNGNWTTSATIASYAPFRVESLQVANAGTPNVLGTLNAGDTVTVTFSKPVLRSSLTSTSVRADGGGADRGFYPGATTSTTTATIGKSAFSAFGAQVTYPGTVAWTNADDTWTWTSTGSGTTMTAALNNEAFTIGTGPKCAADASVGLNGTYAPTSSGRW